MPETPVLPSPMREIYAARCGGKGAIILEQNTNDRIISPETGFDQPISVKYAIYRAFGSLGYFLGEVNKVEGFRPIQPAVGGPAGKTPFPNPHGDPKSAAFLSQLTRALFQKEPKRLLLINGADLLLPDLDPSLMETDLTDLLHLFIELGINDSFRQTQNIIILKSLQGCVNKSLLRSGAFTRIPVPLPDDSSRRSFLSFLSRHQNLGQAIPAYKDAEDLVKVMNGTRLIDIEDLAKGALSRGKQIERRDINLVKSESIEALSQGQLEVVTPDKSMEDVIGLQHIKRFLGRQVALSRSTSRESMPSMMLFMGPPGCGKSHIFLAYANEMDWLYLRLKNIRSQWVGQSEALTQQALEIIEQCAPCIVEVDECDQILGGRSTNAGDGGVDARLFGMILAATGNSSLRGRVQWLLATNRPDLLDGALLDRAGEKLVFLHPCREDRAALLGLMIKQQGRTMDPGVDLLEVSSEPGLSIASARNLIEIVGKAAEFADLAGGEINRPIGQAHLLRAVKEFNAGDTLELEFIALHSLNHLRFKDRLPWIGQDGKILPGYDFPTYLSDIVDLSSGELNTEALIKKLRLLKELRVHERIRK